MDRLGSPIPIDVPEGMRPQDVRGHDRKLKLILEYEGTSFAGWQRQPDRPSIQSTVESAVEGLTGERVTVVGAGRTDAGVHALAQVAHFVTSSRLPAQRFSAALNAHLPPTIRVLAAADVSASFHARYSARGRMYRYVVLNRPAPSSVLRFLAYHIPRPLDVDVMAAALPALLGQHEFTAFRGTGSNERTTICTLRVADVVRKDPLLIFTFEADRFLRHMVRMLVGTLLEVGREKLPPGAVKELLDGSSAYRVGATAPAHGLYLVRVAY